MTDDPRDRVWRAATQPLALLDLLFPMRSPDSVEPQPRESRLYLLACARRAWDRLPWSGRALVGVAERLVDDGDVPGALRAAAPAAAERLTHCHGEPEALAEVEQLLAAAGLARPADEPPDDPTPGPKTWTGLAHLVYYPFAAQTPDFRRIPTRLHSARLVREVFGHPFGGVRLFPPGWRSGTVTALARQMYESGDFSPMPILCDALLDAGCDHPGVLDHCRTGEGHVRGCWVVDRILRG